MSKKKEKQPKEQEQEQKDTATDEVVVEEAPQDEQSDALTKAQEELQKQKESYLRLAAEYDNYRKRTTTEKLSIYADATANAVSNLLPVADSMEMALKSLDGAPEDYKKGIELVQNQLNDAFKKLNVDAFAEIGEEFNPELHNAVSKVENEELGENTISLVFQRGYKVGDKIIRHAMVQVANCD